MSINIVICVNEFVLYRYFALYKAKNNCYIDDK